MEKTVEIRDGSEESRPTNQGLAQVEEAASRLLRMELDGQVEDVFVHRSMEPVQTVMAVAVGQQEHSSAGLEMEQH